jgi:2-haloacid dehalogenase
MNPKICLFDAYGTLFDLEVPMVPLQALTQDRAAPFLALWRQKQLEYSWLRAVMGQYLPFEQVTEDALHYAFEAFDLNSGELFDQLMKIYWQPTLFAEVSTTLRMLKQMGMQLGILSNGSEKLLQAGVKHTDLSSLIDEVISVEAVKTFKPASQVYQTALDRFRASVHDVVFLSANGWDIAGATTFGLSTIWVKRREAPIERLGVSPGHTIENLSGLIECL